MRSETVNIAGYQMRLLVWRVVNKTLKFRLTFLILLTINFETRDYIRNVRRNLSVLFIYLPLSKFIEGRDGLGTKSGKWHEFEDGNM